MKYFLLSLFDWKFEGADIVMDWVALITALGILVTLIVSVVQTAKEKSSLRRDHTDIKDKIGNEKEKLSQKARRFVLAFFFGCYCFLIGNLMTVFHLSGATLLASDR